MQKKFYVATALLVLLAFAIPIEHKYDKLFRFYSLTLIPEGVGISPHFNRKIYFYISDIAALVLMGIAFFWHRIPLRRFFANPLWLLLLGAGASIAASPFFSYPVPYLRLLQLLTPIILFSFLAHAFSEEERGKAARAILMALVAAGLIQTGIGIAQYFNQAPLGLRLLGEPTSKSTIIVPNGSRSSLDSLFHLPPMNHNKVMRATGTLPHANVFGGFLMLSILSTFFLAMAHPIWGFSIPFQFFALTLSYSRSALCALFIGSTIWFGAMIHKFGLKNSIIQFLAITMLVSTALSALILHQQIIGRGGIVNYNKEAQKSDHVRIYLLGLALEVIQKNPFFGVGYGQFSERASDYYKMEVSEHIRETAPHNIFLFIACETGLFSLAALLSFVGMILGSLRHASITLETATLASIFIGFLFIGLCDFYPILFQQGKLMFFLIAGLLAAYILNDKRIIYEKSK